MTGEVEHHDGVAEPFVESTLTDRTRRIKAADTPAACSLVLIVWFNAEVLIDLTTKPANERQMLCVIFSLGLQGWKAP